MESQCTHLKDWNGCKVLKLAFCEEACNRALTMLCPVLRHTRSDVWTVAGGFLTPFVHTLGTFWTKFAFQKKKVLKVFSHFNKRPKNITVFPVKPWIPEKISGLFFVLRLIRCEMKPQKITAKQQHWLVTTWRETSSTKNLQFYHFQILKFFFPISALVSPKNRYEWGFMEKQC